MGNRISKIQKDPFFIYEEDEKLHFVFKGEGKE